MNILIILTKFNRNPYVYDSEDTEPNYAYLMPIGLAYIFTVLKQAGYKADVLNLNHMAGKASDNIIEAVTKKEYDIVITGGVSIYFPNIRDYVKWIREASQKTKVIVGGGLISAQPEIMFDLIKPDYIVIGEGENTVLELVRSIETGSDKNLINGIGYWDADHTMRITDKRDPIMDIDTLPYPDFEPFGLETFLARMKPNYIAYDAFDNPRAYPILASRSCPFSCTFCFHTIGNKYRQRSIDNIMGEIKHAVEKYKVNIFFFYDELFAYDKPRALEFCKRFKEYTDTIPYKIRINLNLRVDCADEEIIDAMNRAGCNPIGLGLESYSSKILTSMKKHTKPEEIRRVLEMIAERGLSPQGSFIFGDVAETLETAKETLDFFRDNQHLIRGARVGFIIPFQGTPLYNHCLETGIIKDEIEFAEHRAKAGYDFHEPINLTGLSEKDFDKLKDMVFTAHYTCGLYSVPIIGKNGDIKIRCPHCGETTIFRNMDPPRNLGLTNVGCRHCNGRFEMVSSYYLLVVMMIRVFGFMRLYKAKKFISGMVHL